MPPSKSQDNTPSCFTDTQGVITTTTNDLPGYKITKILGTVYGLTVRTRNWGTDLGERLVGECMGRGGNAIVAMRFDVSSIGACSQVCAYGTACVVERIEG
jgi:uncharacterized protein YbjQ (UPF0145 family)